MASRTGGYPKTMFLDKIKEEYVCFVCDSVLREPVQRGCGHRMCRQCSQTFSHASMECARCSLRSDAEDVIKVTPEIKEKIFPDKGALADMKHYRCQCPNCHWKGFLKDFEEHCKFCS